MATTPKRRRWSAVDVPDLNGKVAVVTGANSGIGFEAAKVLAEHGATVVLACRNPVKAQNALDTIRTATPAADVSLLEMDLNSLASVRKAADTLLADRPVIDLLINNAGVTFLPYGLTADGFETHYGVNYLGHFAFTGLVLPAVTAADAGRIVTIGSNAHRLGKMNFDDPGFTKGGYKPLRAYARSKLANLLFAFELQRRLQTAGASTQSLAAHPGGANTEILESIGPVRQKLKQLIDHIPNPIVHSARQGALPTLRAATDPASRGDEYYGPAGLLKMTGPPVLVKASATSRHPETAQRLWELSEEQTGVTYPL